MADTISYEELKRRLGDPDVPDEDLHAYIQREFAEGQTGPRLMPTDLVEIESGEEARTRGELGLGILNTWYRTRRHRLFRKRRKDSPEMPVLLAEGDSWFEYPIFLRDVIDVLSARYNVRCLSKAGDEMVDIREDMEHLSELQDLSDDRVEVAAVLLSAGGNDMVGDRMQSYIRPFQEGRPGTWYLDPTRFPRKLASLIQSYRKIVRELRGVQADLPILIHGYDYGNPLEEQGIRVPPRDGWLGRPLRALGIPDGDLHDEIAKALIDAFNDALKTLAGGNVAGGEFAEVYHVDCRDQVGAQWFDELHPTDQGFETVSKLFSDVLQDAGAPPG